MKKVLYYAGLSVLFAVNLWLRILYCVVLAVGIITGGVKVITKV